MFFLGKAVFVAVAAAALICAGPVRTVAQVTAPAAPAQPDTNQGDAFGEEVTLTAKTIVVMNGTATWDSAFETLVDAFKSVQGFLDKQGIKSDGPAMTIYTETSDKGFQFQAGMPVAEEPKEPPRGDIVVAKSPTGKALKFVHRGSFDAMTGTYDAISHHVEEKQISSQELLIEEYVSDFLTTPPDKLVINIFVPLN